MSTACDFSCLGGGDDFLGGVGQPVGADDVQLAFGQDLAAFLDFGAFQAHDQRHVEADRLVGFDDGRGDRRAAHDAAEDVDQHGLHVLVGEQDAEGFGDLLGVGAAADVEEVGRLAAVQLDQVHRAHRQAGAVDQAADVAVELDVAQARLAGADFGRLFFGHVAQLGQVLVAEQGVVVEASSWRRARSARRLR